MSPVSDWREGCSAPDTAPLDLPALGLEFLRRNPAYSLEYDRLREVAPGERERQGQKLARRWGLRFRG